MSRIGVLGGMGPAATVDFMSKLVQLTPARRDQEHLPVVVANLPHVPDRSNAITARGPDPLPYMMRGIDLLNEADCGLVAIPCNTSHHWHPQMAARSRAPVLHIAECCVAAIPAGQVTAVLATRGCLQSGFYQRAIAARGEAAFVPDADGMQLDVDGAIAAVKAGDVAAGAARLGRVLAALAGHGVGAAILGCTELPLAGAHPNAQVTGAPQLVDSTLELARAAVQHGMARGWNHFEPGPAATVAPALTAA